MISLHRSQNSARRGTAFLVSIIAVMVIASLATAMLVVGTGRHSERSSAIQSAKALYVAEAGMSETILRVSADDDAVVDRGDVDDLRDVPVVAGEAEPDRAVGLVRVAGGRDLHLDGGALAVVDRVAED